MSSFPSLSLTQKLVKIGPRASTNKLHDTCSSQEKIKQYSLFLRLLFCGNVPSSCRPRWSNCSHPWSQSTQVSQHVGFCSNPWSSQASMSPAGKQHMRKKLSLTNDKPLCLHWLQCLLYGYSLHVLCAACRVRHQILSLKQQTHLHTHVHTEKLVTLTNKTAGNVGGVWIDLTRNTAGTSGDPNRAAKSGHTSWNWG